MNYPLISEYIEAIKSAEDNFEELSYLRPVLGNDGLPVMTSGNFAVVFKMKDEQSGMFYAVKCFTKEQEGRAEAYCEIAKELEKVSSPYILSIRYLDKELFVDTDQTTETEFPVLLMEWVEGKTLDKYLRENLDDKYTLEMLAYRFSQLAQWLIPQPFAHGDLKLDNILVRLDGSIILVDYDGMYVPAMNGQKSRELGSPDFRHPFRTEENFNEHIDDFPLLSILLSLIAISRYPRLLEEYGATDRLLFSERDYVNIDNNPVINKLFMHFDDNIHHLVCVFISLCKHDFSFTIPSFKKPYKGGEINNYSLSAVNILSRPSAKALSSLSMEDLLEGLIELNDLMEANNIDYVLSGSLGLYIHGMVPSSYIPHDIDIIIDNNNKYPELTNQMILDLFVHYCGGERPLYSNSDYSDLFVFYIGSNKIKIDAFVDRNNVIKNLDFCIVNIENHRIKVHNALSIFKEKYKMHRLKDFEFYYEIQSSLNSLFIPDQTNRFEDYYNDIILSDKIRDYFNGINFCVFELLGTELFTILFNEKIKKIWLPEQLWENIIFKATSWDDSPNKIDSIIFGFKGKFTQISRLDEHKLYKGYFMKDFSYMVDFMHYILSEMNIAEYFVDHVNELVNAINKSKRPVAYYKRS